MDKNKSLENIKHKIDKYEYISFDIFDTLIKRNLPSPSSLFIIVKNKYENKFETHLNDWKNIRIDAEKRARKISTNEEITLNEIYNNISYSRIDLKQMKEIEIETEIELSQINKNIYSLYEYCKNQNKKIIITSDMYLPKTVIEKILHKNNIVYDYLFLSSEIMKTKQSGNIYKEILKTLDIKPEQMLHIGDNKTSDFLRPKKIGINSVLIKNYNNLNFKNYKDIEDNNKFSYDCLEEFINNNIDSSKDYYFRAGYETFGPLLYGYSNWLDKQFKAKKYNHIYFLSRDGYIMQKAYNIICPNNESKYIYASRRALIVPTIWMYKSLQEISNNVSFSNKLTVKEFLKKLGLDSDNYIDVISKYNYNLNQYITLDDIKNNNIEFYKDLKNEIYNNSRKEYEQLLSYFKSIDFNENVAIVDIGWYGNMQNALESISKIANWNVNIYGYYVGIIPKSDKQQKYNMKGFLFEKGKEKLFLKEKFFNSIFELIFLAHHGSVKKYCDMCEKVELYSYEYQDSDTNNDIKRFQDGALKFIKDFYNSTLSKYIEINEDISINNLLRLGNRPSKEDIDNFGNMMFYDDIFLKINNSKSLGYYTLHLKEFINDFELSIWKIGFLKSVFKINIPYFEILTKLRDFKHKKEK